MPKHVQHGIIDFICLMCMMGGIAAMYILGVAAGLR